MTIEAELADGRILEFPDGTDPSVIQATVKRLMGAPPVAPPTERTYGEAAKDIGAGLVSGAGSLVGLPGQLYGLATGDMSDTGSLGLGRKISEYGEEMKSAGLKAREEERAKKIEESAKKGQFAAFKTALGQTVSDPGLLLNFLAEQAPQLLVPFGAGRIGAGAAKLAGAGAEAAAGIGASTGVGTGVLQQGTDVGATAYENIYKELKAQGADDTQAAEGTINLARAAGASGSLISFLASRLPGARKLEELMAGVPSAGTRIGTGIRTAAGEVVSEVPEEVGGKISENLAMREVKPTQDIMAGTGETAALATIGAAGLGGAAGLTGGRRAAPPVAGPAVSEEEPVAPIEPAAPSAPELPAPYEPPAMQALPPMEPRRLRAPEEMLRLPEPTRAAAPVAAEPAPVEEELPPPVEPEFSDADRKALEDYTSGLPSDAAVVFERLQNRDRATPASIQQMKGISSKPDYDRLKTSPDFAQGAPVVMSDVEIPKENFGRMDMVTAADGRKIPVRYAVMSAKDILTSHNSDGQKNPDYADVNQMGIRAVAGNGRIAGLQSAYAGNTANKYVERLLKDNQHGITADAIAGVENPVLVRLMPKSYLTKDIGDVSNISAGLGFNPVEKAKNDASRFDLSGLQFVEGKDGSLDINDATAMQFILAMPKTEQAEMLDTKGRPNTTAMSRLNNAIFYKAYNSDTLIDLFAQATDPEARLILRAMQKAAPKAVQLDGAGEYDIRQNIIDAAELAVNARRDGVKLKDYVKQGMIGVDPKTLAVLEMFADNSRSGVRMGEYLSDLADRAYKQANAGEDMFGAVPKLPVAELFKFPKAEVTEEPPVAAPKPAAPAAAPKPTATAKPAKPAAPPVAPSVAPKPAAPPVAPPAAPKTAKEKDPFQIDKSHPEIAKEITGMTIPELGQWALDNAPNSAAKEMATKVLARLKQFEAKGIYPNKILILNDGRRNKSGVRGAIGLSTSARGIKITLRLNGLVNGQSDNRSGVNYKTILHELTHAATAIQISLNKNDPTVKELTDLYKRVKQQAKVDFKKIDRHPALKRLMTASNAFQHEHELVTYSFTDSGFQDYLSTIKVGDTNALGKLVSLVRKLLGISHTHESALEAVIRVSEQILDTPISKIEAGLQGGIPLKPIYSQEFEQRDPSNFKKWFKNSKVVDENGDPLVMYHGTNKDFLSFDRMKSAEFRRASMDTVGSWFSSQPFKAEQYSGGEGFNVMPVYLSIQNPKVYKTFNEFLREMHSAAGRKFEDQNPKGIGSTEELRAKLKAEGYDGIRFEQTNVKSMYEDVKELQDAVERARKEEYGVKRAERTPYTQKRERLENSLKLISEELKKFDNSTEFDGHDVYIALEPTQIKSVFNEGAYSEESEMILESRAGETVEKVVGAAKQAMQKRAPISKEALKDVDPDYVDALGKVFNPQSETFIDKVESMKDGFFRRAAQGIADQFRTIKDYSEEAYMQARMSKTIDGALEGLLFHGHVFNDGGALNINTKGKGLLEVLEPVGKETDRYMMWIALNREARLPQEKRSPNLADLLADRNSLAEGTIDGKNRLEVYRQVQKNMNAINKSVLNVALGAGLINSSEKDIEALRQRTDLSEDEVADKIAELEKNPGAYERFSSDIFYIPFYKQMEDGDLQGASTASGLTSQEFSKQLAGQGDKPFGDLMENTLRNWSHILSASMKNQAAQSTLDAAMNVSAAIPNLKPQYAWQDGQVVSAKTGEVVGDGSLQFGQTVSGKGMVKLMFNGSPMYFEVLDPMLLDAISAIGYTGPKSKFLDVARDFKNMLQYGVTLSPAFKVRNLIRDSVSAIAVSGLKKNPIANVIEGLSISDPSSPMYISALAGGAIFNFGSTYEGDQAKLIKRLLKSGVREGDILDTPAKIKKALLAAHDAYNDLGNKSEAANRMALYKQMRDKGMSHLEAAFQARDLLDFSMQGSWPAFRLLTQVVPFLNARVQGLYKLGRDGIIPTSRVIYNTATGKPIEASDKVKAQSFSIVTSAVALASMALYFAFKDDEDYKKRDEWDRDNFWWFKLPGMEFAFRIPKPFEIGAFGTVVERITEQIVDEGAEGKQIEESLKRMLGDTFSLNPTPQIIKPLLDLYANKDSFTGAPIESAGMERLSKQERIADSTSPLAILLGGIVNVGLPEKTEMSPVQVDYAIKAYFGWLGGSASWLSHYATMPFSEGTKPDNKWTDTLSMGFIKDLPANQSKYVTSFYDHSKEIGQAYADMRHFAEIGDAAKVEEILTEKGDKIALAKFYDKTSKDMARIRTAIRILTNDKDTPGDQKREEIDRLKLLISTLAQQAEEVRQQMKPL